MKAYRAFGVALVVTASAFILWRLSRAQGGVVTLWDYEPGDASTAGSDGGGNTNPFSTFFHALGNAFKMPGNASAITALPSSPGTPVNPLGPPDTMTRTAQPEGFAFLGENIEYAPNLGDPNFSAWNYLATTPPDLAWGF